MPFLSIIVPIYNSGMYLAKCLESILAQTYKDFELILVNDGSTDNSLEICHEYKEKNENIKIVNKKNGGIVSARKAGVSVASGEYIGYVDSDDYISSVMYENMCAEAIRTRADIVICDAWSVNGSIIIPMKQNMPGGYWNKKDLETKFYPNMILDVKNGEFGILPAGWNKICRADILKRNQMLVDNRIRIGDDVACSYFCMLEANSISYMKNQYFYYYRTNENSVCHIWSKDKIEETKVLLEFLYIRFSEKWTVNCFNQFWEYYCYMYTNVLYEYRIIKGYTWNRNPGIRKDFETLLASETMCKFNEIYKTMDLNFRRWIAIEYMNNPSKINEILWSLLVFERRAIARVYNWIGYTRRV